VGRSSSTSFASGVHLLLAESYLRSRKGSGSCNKDEEEDDNSNGASSQEVSCTNP
jgi:hypothetical protein